ncbi:MAG: hypothetical protein F4138_02440 [Acidimicrobiia bacterium]|nr:hypothetical protein [Acidimicrobiia bacterium]MYC57234.1 hypothetical protein [Acidimicrobiia bacterium]MYG93840.1 hypothetical protein [Acidimicrobiia bacterium]MYI30684.1 hypothetical protein [Acidimicrobiia bacterium]
MAVLADLISVEERFARSSNLERDASRTEPLDGYVVTARALDMIQRIATAATSGPSGSAWSLTGPYGSGKSSLALLLDAAFGPSGEAREAAMGLLNSKSDVGQAVGFAHAQCQTEKRGFHRGLVTSSREPLTYTILRALYTAIRRSYGKTPSIRSFPAARVLRQALEDAEASIGNPHRIGPSPSGLLEVAHCLASDGPLLLIFDEFGKNLEAVADKAATGGTDTDPYLLQQLAEAGQGHGLPIFILTLQHQSFDDYLSSVDAPKRREWAKVQGRFEDVAYVESPAQTRALIGSVFTVNDEKVQNRIQRWSRPQAQAMQSLGVSDLADPSLVASCWPLHPITAVVLSELCRRYGQHERTLFSFLTGQVVTGANGFLAKTNLPSRGPLPVMGLDTVYDYFVGNGGLTSMSAASSSRWIEITTRLRDAHGLSDHQLRVAKAVAMLNLISNSGTIRASAHVVELIEPDASLVLDDLCDIGIITYRSFSDEYRIWQGTDIDIRSLLEEARIQTQRHGILEVMSSMPEPQPIVAARHSAKHDCLRVFCQRYVSCDDKADPLEAFSPYDGQVLLVVDGDQPPPLVNMPSGEAKPTIAAIPQSENINSVVAAARELTALKKVLQNPMVKADWVARHELSERLAVSQIIYDHTMCNAFTGSSCRWLLLDGDTEKELQAGRGSSVLSDAAERAYPSTPAIPNETINRTHLTSQGAKARRILIEAMLEHGSEPSLGLKGNGPEVAIYKATLAHTQLHVPNKSTGQMVFTAPTGGKAAQRLQSAWKMLEAAFKQAKCRKVNLNDIIASLQSPPLGMKAGVVPVIIVASLLAHRDVIAIYEHGTFKPQLTSDMAERMVKNPGFFEIKHFANTTGARQQVIDAIADRLEVRPSFRQHRVVNVLAVVSHLVSQVNRLDNYTLRTRNLPEVARKARETLVTAVEPDELLFNALPKALGFRAVSANTKTYTKARAYANSVGEALEILAGCFSNLLGNLCDLLLEESGETSRLAVVGQAAALKNEVLNPTVRAFVLALANDSLPPPNMDWIKAIAMVVVGKAPAEWTDDDLARFRHIMPEHIAAFHRLVALYAERRAGGGGPFDALRITITQPDGSELARLVGIDQNNRQALEQVLDDILKKLSDVTGSQRRAEHALLALLGERMLSIKRTEEGTGAIEANLQQVKEAQIA